MLIGTLVGFLFLHFTEAKEHWTDLADMHLVPLNGNMIWFSVTCLLPNILSNSLRCCPQWASNFFHQVFSVYIQDWMSNVHTNLKTEYLLCLAPIQTVIIHIVSSWAASPVFTLIHQMLEPNWYRFSCPIWWHLELHTAIPWHLNHQFKWKMSEKSQDTDHWS